MQDKKRIRQKLLQQLKTMSPSECRRRSELVRQNLARLLNVLSGNVLAAFMAVDWECDLTAVVEAWQRDEGRTIYPRWIDDGYRWVETNAQTEWGRGRFGILEPEGPWKEWQEEDAIFLVPGIAFTTSGIRLGRGGGHYDRLLAGQRGVRIGICYQFQIMEQLPSQHHDIRMDFLVTDESLYHCMDETNQKENTE